MEDAYTIYGIRLKGSKEARYIGQTIQPVEARLAAHIGLGVRMPRPTLYAKWLRAHRDDLEVFKIGYADTLAEARGIERVAIALCLRLGHRLFNHSHVPAELRLPAYGELELVA